MTLQDSSKDVAPKGSYKDVIPKESSKDIADTTLDESSRNHARKEDTKDDATDLTLEGSKNVGSRALKTLLLKTVLKTLLLKTALKTLPLKTALKMLLYVRTYVSLCRCMLHV